MFTLHLQSQLSPTKGTKEGLEPLTTVELPICFCLLIVTNGDYCACETDVCTYSGRSWYR